MFSLSGPLREPQARARGQIRAKVCCPPRWQALAADAAAEDGPRRLRPPPVGLPLLGGPAGRRAHPPRALRHGRACRAVSAWSLRPPPLPLGGALLFLSRVACATASPACLGLRVGVTTPAGPRHKPLQLRKASVVDLAVILRVSSEYGVESASAVSAWPPSKPVIAPLDVR